MGGYGPEYDTHIEGVKEPISMGPSPLMISHISNTQFRPARGRTALAITMGTLRDICYVVLRRPSVALDH